MASSLASTQPPDDTATPGVPSTRSPTPSPHPFWLESTELPESNPTLVRDEHCDLCIVGGGYTGLWTAIVAKERDPSRDVVLIDKGEVGGAASGRNGGFVESSLTHGVVNGLARHGDELDVLEELGLRNLDEIEATIERYGIDCSYERTGVIDVAHDGHPASYVDELREEHDVLRAMGQQVEWLDGEAMRAEVHSPTYTAGLVRAHRAALVDPARLAWGLKRVAEELGVRIYEHSKATELDRDGVGMIVDHSARSCPLRTGGAGHQRRQAPPEAGPAVHGAGLRLLPGDRAAQRASRWPVSGWARRQGLSDITNQFHYYRLTADNRILWGGYDAIYYWGSKTSVELESRPETWAKLATHFFQTFPAARGPRLHARLGRGDRHEHPVLGVLRDGDAEPGRLRRRVHRTRRGCDPVRRDDHARPAGRPTVDRHEDRLRPVEAAAVPARAVPVRRHPGHPLVVESGGPDRTPQRVAADSRSARVGFRLVTSRFDAIGGSGALSGRPLGERSS